MWIRSFIDYLKYEKCCSDYTVTSYRTDLLEFKEFIKENFCRCSPEEAESTEIREWVIHLMEQGLKATSVKRKLSALRSFFKFLRSRGVVSHNPTSRIKGPGAGKPLPVFVREEEMEKVLSGGSEEEDGFCGVRDRLIIEVFYTTGIRLSELIALKDKDVDLYSCTVKVLGKRNKQRIIPFGEELKEHLRDYLRIRSCEFGSECSESFFVLQNGKQMYPFAVYRLVKRELSKVVTLKKRSPHVLRHTFATTMLNNEASLNAVKEILGHESLETTEIYTHTTFEELKKVYNQAHPRA